MIKIVIEEAIFGDFLGLRLIWIWIWGRRIGLKLILNGRTRGLTFKKLLQTNLLLIGHFLGIFKIHLTSILCLLGLSDDPQFS